MHSYYAGIQKQTTELMEKWQVSRFDVAVNDKFDVARHRLVGSVETEEVEPVIEALASRTADTSPPHTPPTALPAPGG